MATKIGSIKNAKLFVGLGRASGFEKIEWEKCTKGAKQWLGIYKSAIISPGLRPARITELWVKKKFDLFPCHTLSLLRAVRLRGRRQKRIRCWCWVLALGSNARLRKPPPIVYPATSPCLLSSLALLFLHSSSFFLSSQISDRALWNSSWGSNRKPESPSLV